MSRPSLRRALRRAGLPRLPPQTPPPEDWDAGPPPPRIFLPGEGGSDVPAPIDLASLFGRSAPTELEIGTGRGRFLLLAASQNTERNFLGLELERDYARIAMAKAAELGLVNVRIEAADGKAFVESRLPQASLAALHVFFPDPWPKRRHHKRRLFDEAFAKAAARALAPGALLRVASDHLGYFAVIEALLDAEPALERIPAAEAGDWSSETNYELKFQAEGRAIGRGIWRRLSEPIEGARPSPPPSPESGAGAV